MSPEAQRRSDRMRTGPFSLGALHRSSIWRRDESAAKPGSDLRSQRSEVISEPLFKGVLVREQKRVHRSDRSYAVLLVSVDERAGARALLMWESISESLAAAKRETDIVGWFAQGKVLGVILTEIASRDAAIVSGFEARVRRELGKRLTPKDASSVSVRLRIEPELTNQDVPGKTHGALKRGLDLIGSLTLLLALSPVLVVIAALVKLSSKGQVFFRQERIGEKAQPFKILKFRTMFTGVDHALHHEFVTRFITSSGECSEPGTDAPFKIANDPRVTPLGRVLRKTSLDELPQLWNVVRGEMSLVGPRPPLAYEVEVYQSWHRRRVLEAKPGITGPWQVGGRSRTTFDEMVRLDLRYARKPSLWTDIKILLLTPAAVFEGRGAS